MTQATVDTHGAVPEHHSATGISHNKLLMWAFLASDCMFFGALIMTYMIFRGQHGEGIPSAHELFDIPFTSVSAAVLLLSSLSMVLALSALQQNKHRAFRAWLGATCALGALFLGGQYYEFTEFAHEGLTLSDIFGSTFFVLTGTHGTHVGIGVIWLLSIVLMSLRGQIPSSRSEMVEIAGLYWHFVDIVWIIIFTLIYLIPYQ